MGPIFPMGPLFRWVPSGSHQIIWVPYRVPSNQRNYNMPTPTLTKFSDSIKAIRTDSVGDIKAAAVTTSASRLTSIKAAAVSTNPKTRAAYEFAKRGCERLGFSRQHCCRWWYWRSRQSEYRNSNGRIALINRSGILWRHRVTQSAAPG